MMWLVYASMTVCVLAAVGALGLICIRLPRKEGIFTVKETWMTAVMGLILLAVGVFAGCAKLADNSVAGTDTNSWFLISALTTGCGILGGYTILFGLLRRVVVFDDRIIFYSAFGVRRGVRWKEIVRVEKGLLTRALKLTAQDKRVYSVSGESAEFERFVSFAKTHISQAKGSQLVAMTESRLRGGKHR